MFFLFLMGVSAIHGSAATPVNDNIGNSTVITGQVITVNDNNTGATFSGDPRWAENQGGHSVWYSWTAPATESVRLSGSGQGYALLINVLAQLPSGSRALAAANAMDPMGTSVSFAAHAGRTYYISADGYLGEQGPFTMSLRRLPPNDNFNDRMVLEGDFFRINASNEGATQNGGEPNHAGAVGGRSLWWSWTAPASGPVTLSLADHGFTPLLAVYTGGLGSFTSVASNNASGTFEPSLTFAAAKGVTYQIVVDGLGGASGSFVLGLEMNIVRVSSPVPEQVFQSPANITLTASAPTNYGSVRRIDFFNASLLVGTITNTHSESLWTNVSGGLYALTARAEYESGFVQTSRPINFFVSTNVIPPAPQIAAGTLSVNSYWLNTVGQLFAAGSVGQKTFAPVAYPPGVTAWTRVANDYGYGNNGTLYRSVRNPVALVTGVSRWVAAAEGVSYVPGGYSLGVGDNGVLYSKMITAQPIAQPFPTGVARWLDVGVGNSPAMALGDNGQIYTWADDALGQFGVTPVPHRAVLPSGVAYWKRMAIGNVQHLAIGNDDKLYAWGFNYSGQLGMGDRNDRAEPTLVPALSGVTGWKSIAAGAHFSLGLANNGQLFAWGRNWENQLGIGYSVNKEVSRPLPVVLPNGVTHWFAIAAGTTHALAIGSDCRLYSWGENQYGQLGNGIGAGQPEPMLVTSIGNVCGPGSIRITEPTAGSLFHAPAAIRVTAITNFIFGALQKVEFLAGDTKLGVFTNTPFSLIWSNPPPGQHWIKARAQDNTGTTTISSAVNILVNARPEVALTFPTNGTTLTAGGSFTLTATATDSDGQIALVEFFHGTNKVGEATHTPFEILLANLAPGVMDFTARATDDLGGATTSSPLLITVVPNQPPSFTMGTNLIVSEDCGPQITADWTSIITAGSPHESAQTLAFIVANSNPSLFIQQPWIDLAGNLYFTPVENANGAAQGMVTLKDNGGTAFGGQDTSVSQFFTITVLPVNDAPVASAQTLSVNEDTALSLTLTGFDVEGDALTYSIVSPPTHGSLSGTAPNLTYLAVTNYSGPDSFTFKVNDGQLDSAPATVSLTVLPVNDAPESKIVVSPLTKLPGISNLVVIARVCCDAIVILDGSQSADVENDSLQFVWTEGTNTLGTTATVTNHFAPGNHVVSLAVSDGVDTNMATATFAVLSPAQAVHSLVLAVREAEVFPKHGKERDHEDDKEHGKEDGKGHSEELSESLHDAEEAFRRCQARSGLHKLEEFQHKVRAQIGRRDPALAQMLIETAQEIIDIVGGTRSSPCHVVFDKVTPCERGKMQMKFSARKSENYFVQASTDLKTWKMIGVAEACGDGTFLFEDPCAGQHPQRFYRIHSD